MKTYLVYLSDGAHFKITADDYEFPSDNQVAFNKENTVVAIFASAEVLAIINSESLLSMTPARSGK